MSDMTGAAPQPKQCEWIKRMPIYLKELAGFKIDKSEFVGPEGVIREVKEIPCRYIADPGKKYCPRHEMEAAMRSEAA